MKRIELTEESALGGTSCWTTWKGEIDSMAKWVEEPAQEYVLKMQEIKEALKNAITL